MNFVSILLISTYSVTMVSMILATEIDDSLAIRYVKECCQEQNITDVYSVEDIKTISIPSDQEEACLLDCYFRKRGQIVQKNNSSPIQYKFAALPLDSSVYGRGFNSMSTTQAEAVESCMKIIPSLPIGQCWLMYRLRFCLHLELN